MIGLINTYGQGLPQDHEEAVRFYRLVIELGDILAIELLGTIYRNCWGVPKDIIEALRLYRFAAMQGKTGALYWLEKGVRVRRWCRHPARLQLSVFVV